MYVSSTYGADSLRMHTNAGDIYGVLLCGKFWKISQVDTAIHYIRRLGRDEQMHDKPTRFVISVHCAYLSLYKYTLVCSYNTNIT